MEYDFVFIVLVYRNTSDLTNYFYKFNIEKSKVIVVNSYYDDKTTDQFRKIAIENGADFITVPNKGYGYGNNRGCDYAINKYKFKYLVISNADIVISRMSIDALENNTSEIIAPDIRDLKGVRQNPHMAFREPKIIYDIKSHLYRLNTPIVIDIIFSIVSRINKWIFYSLNTIFNRTKVYAAHGAFLIVPQKVLKTLMPLYDENIFLFGEETHLAIKAERMHIKTIYNNNIKIQHKEDGSVSFENINSYKMARKSFYTIYNNWFAK